MEHDPVSPSGRYYMPPAYQELPRFYREKVSPEEFWREFNTVRSRTIDRTSAAAWALGFSIVGIFLYVLCVPGLALGMYVAGSGDKYDKVRGKGMGIAAAIISGIWLLFGSMAITIIILTGNLDSIA